MHTRYCPNCDDEFRADIVACSDCGGELEDRYDDDEGWRRREGSELPEPQGSPEPYQPVFRCDEGASLREAVGVLTAAGIPIRVSGAVNGFALYVPEAQVPAAAAALRGREGVLVLPDDAEPSVGPEGGACPACAAPVPAGAAECPECGLMVGAEPEDGE